MKKRIEVSSSKALIMGLLSVLFFMFFDYLFTDSKAPANPYIDFYYALAGIVGYFESLLSQIITQLNENAETEKENEE